MTDIENRTFLRGEFVILGGTHYRVRAYPEEYELFNPEDTLYASPIRRIDKLHTDGHYFQFAWCDIGGVRYTAENTEDGYCHYSSVNCSKAYPPIRVEECNEIWITRNYPDKSVGTEIVFINPNCKTQPDKNRFYAERMANGNIMTSHTDEDMSIEKTIENLRSLYGVRIEIRAVVESLYDELFDTFRIDGNTFMLTYDAWGIVCISPESAEGNPYICEIADYFNR